MNRLLLVDAYAFVYRAYYAFIKTPRMTSDGRNTSAIYGFVTMFNELKGKLHPTHIGVAFDPKGKTFRHEAFEQYKAQRPDTPEDIHAAVPYIKDILRAMNIPVLEKDGFEADDVIGTLARQAEQAGFEVFMATPDKDYGQLVSDHVFMYRPRHNGGYEQMGPAEVCAKYGLKSHTQVIDLLGLMGDSSDNIPGCKGVGEKTAVKLLQDFGSIDNLLASTDQLKGALKTKIEEGRDQILFSRFLATIRTDVPVSFNAQDMVVCEPDKKALADIYRGLEFRTLLKRMGEDNGVSEEPKSIPELSVTSEVSGKTGGVQLDLFALEETSHQTMSVMPRLVLAIDMPVKPAGHDLFSSLEEPELHLFYTSDGQNISSCRLGSESLPSELANLLSDSETEKSGFDLKTIYKQLLSRGITLKGPLFDIGVAHYLLQPELRHDAGYLSEVYLHTTTPDTPQSQVSAAWRLRDLFFSEYKKIYPDNTLLDTEMQLIPVLADMETAGVRFNTKVLAEASASLHLQATELENEITALAGTTFNVNSPRQVGEVLFDRLRLDPNAKTTKGGQYSTSEDILLAIRDKHPIVDKILDYRELKKLLSTYIDALPALINHETGKIHTTYNQTVTATGRLSSSNPNLQNLPIRSQRGKEIRRAVVPDTGHLFLSADYSQIELRLMAHFSGDEHMLNAFRQGQDIHRATAAKIFNCPIDAVTDDMRRKAKTANFGIIYGISAFGLAQQLSSSRSEAKQLIEEYFASFPKVVGYIEQAKQQARQTGYTQTLFARRRYLPDINSRNPTVRNYAERNAVNAPIQGTAADIIKMAMVRIHKQLVEQHLHTKMIMQIHDELCFDVPKGEEDVVRNIVVNEMQNVVRLSVPLVADCGTGSNWLEAH